jgi:hypothetical protein
LAINQHTPVVVISVSPKLSAFFDTMGMSKLCYSMDQAGQDELKTFIGLQEYFSVPDCKVPIKIAQERRKISNVLQYLVKHETQSLHQEVQKPATTT